MAILYLIPVFGLSMLLLILTGMAVSWQQKPSSALVKLRNGSAWVAGLSLAGFLLFYLVFIVVAATQN